MVVDIPLFQPLVDGLSLSFGDYSIVLAILCLAALITLIMTGMEGAMVFLLVGGLLLMMAWAMYGITGTVGVVVIVFALIVGLAMWRLFVK